MKISYALPSLLLALLVSELSPTASGQNLIINPYFTQGFSGWNGTYGIYTRAMNPSPLYGNTAGIVDAAEPAMYQSFDTEIGVTYEVTWNVRLPDLGPNGVPIEGQSFVGPAGLNVDLNGQFMSETIQNRTAWESYTVDFTATGTSTELSFQVPQYINGSLSEDVFMDYVSAVAVPEPSNWAMLLLAFSAFLLKNCIAGRGSPGSARDLNVKCLRSTCAETTRPH